MGRKIDNLPILHRSDEQKKKDELDNIASEDRVARRMATKRETRYHDRIVPGRSSSTPEINQRISDINAYNKATKSPDVKAAADEFWKKAQRVPGAAAKKGADAAKRGAEKLIEKHGGYEDWKREMGERWKGKTPSATPTPAPGQKPASQPRPGHRRGPGRPRKPGRPRGSGRILTPVPQGQGYAGAYNAQGDLYSGQGAILAGMGSTMMPEPQYQRQPQRRMVRRPPPSMNTPFRYGMNVSIPLPRGPQHDISIPMPRGPQRDVSIPLMRGRPTRDVSIPLPRRQTADLFGYGLRANRGPVNIGLDEFTGGRFSRRRRL